MSASMVHEPYSHISQLNQYKKLQMLFALNQLGINAHIFGIHGGVTTSFATHTPPNIDISLFSNIKE